MLAVELLHGALVVARVACIGALPTRRLRLSDQARAYYPFLALGRLHLLEGHRRLRLRVKALEVQLFVRLAGSVARHHQVVRLVQVLYVLLYSRCCSSGALEWVLLRDVAIHVCGTGLVLSGLRLEVQLLRVSFICHLLQLWRADQLVTLVAFTLRVVDQDHALVSDHLLGAAGVLLIEIITISCTTLAITALHLRGLLGGHGDVSGDRRPVMIDSILRNDQQVTGVIVPSYRLEGLVLRVAKLANDLASILLRDPLSLSVDCSQITSRGSAFVFADVVRVLLHKCGMVLLISTTIVASGVQLGTLSVEDLGLPVGVLGCTCTDLDASLVDTVGLQLQAVVVAALVTVMMRLGLAHARLVVVKDIAYAFSTALVLREATHFIRSAFTTCTILIHR